MRQRFAPFLVLLEARYAPLLFAVGPQAYAIYLWLFPVPYALTGEFFAIIGALGYEFIYVGAIAWAEEGKAGRWTWATAAVALVFSVAVAIFVYQAQGWWSVLHAGFPLVAFGYTMQLHGMAKREHPSAVVSTAQTALDTDVPAQAPLEQPSESIASAQEELSDPEQTATPVPVAGYVYALLSEQNGVKIGCATNADKRFRSIASFLPFEVQLFHVIPSLDMYALERSIHRYYEIAGKRINGEWFRLDAYDLQALKQVSIADSSDIFEDASRVLAPMVLRGVQLLDNVDSSLILRHAAKQYACPHCGQALTSKQALGAAVKNGYCLGCKRRIA